MPNLLMQKNLVIHFYYRTAGNQELEVNVFLFFRGLAKGLKTKQRYSTIFQEGVLVNIEIRQPGMQ